MTPAREHTTWAKLDPVTQAGIRCNDPVFRAFLKETYPDYFNDPGDESEDIDAEESAAQTVRSICEIESRRELATDLRAQAMWRILDDMFQAWLARER